MNFTFTYHLAPIGKADGATTYALDPTVLNFWVPSYKKFFKENY